MRLIDYFIKKAIIQSRNADRRSLFFRWLTLTVLFLLFWSVSALIINPLLFPLSFNFLSEPANTLQNTFRLISLFFNPMVLFLVFTFLAACLLAYKCVEEYFVSIHGKANLKFSRFALWKKVFGIPKDELIIISDSQQEEKNLQPLKQIGGPARIMVPAENALILENHNYQVQIIGPTMNLPGNYYLMNNFDLLKDVFNLQNQSVQIKVKIQTKDGQKILINNLQAIFSVQRDRETTTLTRPYPFKTHSIFTLYYDTAPGSLEEKFVDILKCGLMRYARRFNFSELFGKENNLSAKIVNIQSQYQLPSFFRKRQKFNAIIRKPVFSFFQKHTRKKSWFLQRKLTKIRPLYLDLISAAENHASHLEEKNSSDFTDFIKNFQTYISPHLHQKGFQLHLLSYGTINFEKKNENININLLKKNKVDRLEEYTQNQITQLLRELNHSYSIFSGKENKKENLEKIRIILERSLFANKGKLIFHDRQLEKAIENIDQLIRSQE